MGCRNDADKEVRKGRKLKIKFWIMRYYEEWPDISQYQLFGSFSFSISFSLSLHCYYVPYISVQQGM